MSEPRAPFAEQEDPLTARIIHVYYQVYNELGFGFLESVYCRAMAIALQESGLRVASEVQVPVWFHGQLIGAFRADLIVEGKIILELKTTEQIAISHASQLQHYLRSSDIEVGLILNFGETPRFRRIEFSNERKKGKLKRLGGIKDKKGDQNK